MSRILGYFLPTFQDSGGSSQRTFGPLLSGGPILLCSLGLLLLLLNPVLPFERDRFMKAPKWACPESSSTSPAGLTQLLNMEPLLWCLEPGTHASVFRRFRGIFGCFWGEKNETRETVGKRLLLLQTHSFGRFLSSKNPFGDGFSPMPGVGKWCPALYARRVPGFSCWA